MDGALGLGLVSGSAPALFGDGWLTSYFVVDFGGLWVRTRGAELRMISGFWYVWG